MKRFRGRPTNPIQTVGIAMLSAIVSALLAPRLAVAGKTTAPQAKAAPQAETTTPAISPPHANTTPASSAASGKRHSPPAPSDFSSSVTLSPYHLAFPMGYAAAEFRLLQQLGVSAEFGAGGFRGATVAQLGTRVSLYAIGSFNGGFEVGPFARLTLVDYASPRATSSPVLLSAHSVAAPVYNDVEFTRANGRHGFLAGGFVGGKFALTKSPRDMMFVRGFTARAGVIVGWFTPFGDSEFGPDPDASRVGSGVLPLIDIALGWSF